MSDYITSENEARNKAYQKNKIIQKRLINGNSALERVEEYEWSKIQRPNLFIFGLPRSGTTLLYQTIVKSLDIGYVNNLMARFWRAPLFGATLSKDVLGEDRSIELESVYATTKGPYGPHEFGYFWQHWLNIKNIEDTLDFNKGSVNVKWEQLNNVLGCVQDTFDKGLVFKTMYVANYIREFAQNFSMPLFIYIQRNPADVALSILEGRKAYYGDKSMWWSTFSENYFELEKLPYYKQIAGQVRSLRKTYEESLKLVNPDQVVRINYADLCENPDGLISEIQGRLNNLYGYQQDRLIKNVSPLNKRSFSLEKLDEEKQKLINEITDLI